MGKKSKKSLANRLAKMSDEERARYAQHKAEIEEEAKRRKEQLISTFMKKKIKKEEAFGRLNLAKINQNWHQILRKAKCKEMKENVEHMQKWIERVLTYKNRTISKLLEELENAEEQYLNNFQSHSLHIDNIIDSQNNYLAELQQQYEDDLAKISECSQKELDYIRKVADEEQKYLLTTLFQQETNGKKALRETKEEYMLKIIEDDHEYKSSLNILISNREKISVSLWRRLASMIRTYIATCDARRMHLCEMRRLDEENAVQISKNQEVISAQEENLKQFYSKLEDMDIHWII